ncbi:hypothetical protein BJV74DRAFT_589174 [Russula compacta]|nr:hypothetical protein BJV74DRAFT_589174 [Russula compacta]
MDAENVAAAESGVLEHDAGAARLTIAEEEKEHSKSLAIAHSLFKPTSVVSSGYAPPSPPITPRDSTCPPLGYGYDDREDCGLLCDMEDWQTSMESDYLFEAPLLRWLTVPVLTPLLEEGEGAQTRQDATDLLFLEPSLGRSPEGGPPSSSDGIDIPKVKICHAAAPTHIHHHSRNGGVSVVSGEMREPEPAQRAQRGRNRSRGRGPRWYGRGGRRSS